MTLDLATWPPVVVVAVMGLVTALATSWEARTGQVVNAESVAPESDAQCCYARAEKVWLTDPDGHKWELWHRTGEFDAMGETRPDAEKEGRCCG